MGASSNALAGPEPRHPAWFNERQHNLLFGRRSNFLSKLMMSSRCSAALHGTDPLRRPIPSDHRRSGSHHHENAEPSWFDEALVIPIRSGSFRPYPGRGFAVPTWPFIRDDRGPPTRSRKPDTLTVLGKADSRHCSDQDGENQRSATLSGCLYGTGSRKLATSGA